MADFERSTTVGVGADRAFELFAEPQRMAEYVSVMAHVETTVIEGDAKAEGDVPGSREPAQARFFVDRGARRVEWGLDGSDYAGSITVAAGTLSTSQVTIRLHARGDGPSPEIDRVLDETVRNVRRLLSGR